MVILDLTVVNEMWDLETIRRLNDLQPGAFLEVPPDYDFHMVDQHAPGAKLDHGKVRMGLVLDGFSDALVEVSKVGTFGARKYSDNGWKYVEDGYARYRDALFRHLFAADLNDDESGLPHLAHAAWNLLAMLELTLDKIEERDEHEVASAPSISVSEK